MSSGTASTTTEDAFLGGTLTLCQPTKGYRISSDAVLLAALVPLAHGQKALDLGTGYGQIALCLIAREPTLHVTGLELMPQAAALARHNAKLNHKAANFAVIEGDVATYAFESKFDLVVSNPPYRLASGHTASANPVKAAATIEDVPLTFWAKAASAALKSNGEAYFIHDARREADLVAALMATELQDITILPLASMPGAQPLRIAVRARRGNAQLVRLPIYELHRADGSWLPEVDSVLRGPLELALWPK